MNRSRQAHQIAPTPAQWSRVVDVAAEVGEGPAWSARERAIYFVDIPARRIYRHSPANGSLRTFGAPQLVTSVVVRAGGGLLVSLERTVAFFDPASGRFDVQPTLAGEPPSNRFNDGKCDRRGRFFTGTMSKTEWAAPLGTLYRYQADMTPAAVVTGVRCSNGLGWSPDGRVLYYVESFAHTIWAFDYDIETGALGAKRVFATLDPASGAFPDGLTVDAEGFVWNAQPVFGRLVRYAPDGSIDRIVEAPVSRPTSCIFGGDDMATLYVTSAWDSLDERQRAEEPWAGALLSFRPGVTGIPETPFAG